MQPSKVDLLIQHIVNNFSYEEWEEIEETLWLIITPQWKERKEENEKAMQDDRYDRMAEYADDAKEEEIENTDEVYN